MAPLGMESLDMFCLLRLSWDIVSLLIDPFFIASFFIVSLDIESFFMLSFDIESLDIESLDMASLDIESLDIVSFDIVSFFMASWAKAAGPSARANDRVAADSMSAMRFVMILISSEKRVRLGDGCHPLKLRWRAAAVTRFRKDLVTTA